MFKLTISIILQSFRSIKLIKLKLFGFLFPNIIPLIMRRVTLKGKLYVNQPVYFNGLGEVTIGMNCSLGYKFGAFNRGGSIGLQARYKKSIINIGDNVSTNNNIWICAANKIIIGSDTLIGQNVVIMDFDAHGILPHNRGQIGEIGSVIIGKNVWIGSNVTILKNSYIGDNSIVAAGAVVTGKFGENVVLGGVPAKVIKRLDNDK